MTSRRYTVFMVTVNSNWAAKSALSEQYMGDKLESFFTSVMTRPDVWHNIITVTPRDAVDNISMKIGIERGNKRHFMHAHAIVTIEHHGKVDKYTRQGYVQHLLNQHIPELKGAYVQIKLASAAPLNYVAQQMNIVDDIGPLAPVT